MYSIALRAILFACDNPDETRDAEIIEGEQLYLYTDPL